MCVGKFKYAGDELKDAAINKKINYDDEIYYSLREFLDRLPGGYPKTVSGVEIKILKKLFTPEQAIVALCLTQRPEPAAIIAKKLGWGQTETAKMLDSMANQGLIISIQDKSTGNFLYSALQFMPGIYELQVNTLDQELAKYMEEYLPHLSRVWEVSNTKQFRIVPIGASISPNLTISSYEKIDELIKDVKVAAVAPCVCVKEQMVLGNNCHGPLERCLVFNNAAQRYLEQKKARKINKNELLDILKMGEEKALVPSLMNVQKIINICLCCKCCCGVLRMLKNFSRPAEQIHSSFQAKIDSDLCISCGICKERCQMDAISNGETYEINKDRCIGCGLCVPTCPSNAISLEPKPLTVPIPNNLFEMRINIMKDRGLA